jgi:hypothetical protein
MRDYRDKIRVLVAVGAAALLSAVLGAADQVPFKARVSGASTIDPRTGFEDFHGLGRATHLGQSTAHMQHFVTLDIEVIDGRFILTAANGDQVCGSYAGQGTPTQVDPLLIDFEGTFAIEGGTGRFAGATGGGRIFGLVDPFPDEGVPEGTAADLTFDGTITRPGGRSGDGDSDQACSTIGNGSAP